MCSASVFLGGKKIQASRDQKIKTFSIENLLLFD